MTRHQPASAAPLALLAAASDLVRQRAAGVGTAPVSNITVYADEAATVFTSLASGAHGLVAELIRSSRNPAVYGQPEPRRRRRQQPGAPSL